MRWIGAMVVFLCGGYFGFSMVALHRKEEKSLRQIATAINYMQCEIQYRLTPLPQLVQQASKQINGTVSLDLEMLAIEMESQILPDVSCCMEAVLRRQMEIYGRTREVLSVLGRCLGRFDLQGQLNDLDSVEALCRRYLSELDNNRDTRLRSYQTLGLCAGAAIAILLL